jgi:flagellar M-ring protein FliF
MMTEQQIIAASTAIDARPISGGWQSRTGGFGDFLKQPAVTRALPAIGIAAALGITAAAWFALQSPTQAMLYAGLAEGDKAAVAEALQSSGIGYSLDPASGALSVDADRLHEAKMMLAGQGLPKAQPSGDAMLQALPMGASRALEGETLRGAREADLARTIEAIDAVRIARVHIALPEASVFVRENKPAAASVMLTMQQGRTLSEAQVRAIRHLVASSVPGMGAADVSVIDQSGALLSAENGTNADSRMFELQVQMEQRYRQAVSALLAPIVGPGNFSVEVHAEIDASESQATRETYPENDRALRSEEGNKSNSSDASQQAGGIPGALSNQPPPAATVASTPGGTAPATPQTQSGESSETFARSFDVGREISVTHNPQGKLNRISVAVALRQAKGAKAMPAADLAKVEALVKGAVGFDAERGDAVAVSAQPFAETAETPTPLWEEPWFWPMLRQGGAVLGAIIALLVIGLPIRKALKKRAAAREAEAALIEQQLLAAADSGALPGGTPPREVTLEMIEAAPGYEARANLVRAFVRQDAGRAALVVRQLMQGAKP